jgi:hypothetical protein
MLRKLGLPVLVKRKHPLSVRVENERKLRRRGKAIAVMTSEESPAVAAKRLGLCHAGAYRLS